MAKSGLGTNEYVVKNGQILKPKSYEDIMISRNVYNADKDRYRNPDSDITESEEDPYEDYEPISFDIKTVVMDLEKKIKLHGLSVESKRERKKLKLKEQEETDIIQRSSLVVSKS